MLRGAVWEELNSRDLCNPDLVSSLSTCNDEYYRAIREKHKASESVHDGSGSGNRESREEHHQKQLKEMTMEKQNMVNILKFLNQKEIERKIEKDENEKIVIEKEFQSYANFIQAQMTTPELFLLFYNSLSFPKLLKLLIHSTYIL